MMRRYLESYAKKAIPNAWVIDVLLKEGGDMTSRRNPLGHVTASAFIVDRESQSALLIHHAGLGLWLMPGGHVDEGETPLQAALREAGEEVGLANLTPLVNAPVDCDIHRIPASEKKNEGSHWHIDFRFLAVAQPGAAVELNTNECLDFKWVAINELLSSDDRSLSEISRTYLTLARS